MNIAPDGRLWVADSTRGRFVIVDPDGEVADIWQPSGEAALDLVQPDNDLWGAVAFATDGSFFVADTDHQRVLRFDADRKLVGSWGSFGPGEGQFVSPFGLTVGSDGLVYVVDDPTCRVQVFEPSGAYVRTVAGGAEFVDRCTNNVVVGPDGTIFLASGGRGDPWRITVFDPSGAVLRRIGEGVLREPVLLARGPDGEIHATDGTDRLISSPPAAN
jgi:sugar lactone lactonase YvrE